MGVENQDAQYFSCDRHHTEFRCFGSRQRLTNNWGVKGDESINIDQNSLDHNEIHFIVCQIYSISVQLEWQEASATFFKD